ncbi:MAG: metallophosphoesterase [Mogibacterium sp.]|nr:metallophosphoesterase [Mogibacterium sp.]MBQ6500288.1 metallophosphoesterase [Mogibacterium sp.]
MSREKRTEKHMAPEPKRKKRGLWWKIPMWIIIIAVLLAGSAMAVNYGVSLHLRHYISSFDPVQYDEADRLVPEIDPETGYYTFTTDRDLRIMMLTDIHLGGGFWSREKDRKTVYEVITMLQKEKPDLVILDGDNTFAVPGPVYNGGGTLNNYMAARDVIQIFNHEGVYFSTVFGNHDTEVFDYTDRQKLGELYMNDKFEYCIFDQNYTDGGDLPTVTNQIIQVKNTKGELTKALLLIDSNAYVDDSIQAVLDWNYDIIRDSTVDWAAESIKALGSPKTVAFFHIPTSEYRIAYEELAANGWKDTKDTKYVSGVWDELIDDSTHSRIWHGGITKEGPLADIDKFFETLGPDGMKVLEACYCGHDHVNNAVVNYKGVDLCYGYSVDNLAYADINYSGAQRGATIITISPDGKRKTEYKNAYKDYGVPADKFVEVYTDHLLYEGGKPEGVLMP